MPIDNCYGATILGNGKKYDETCSADGKVLPGALYIKTGDRAKTFRRILPGNSLLPEEENHSSFIAVIFFQGKISPVDGILGGVVHPGSDIA